MSSNKNRIIRLLRYLYRNTDKDHPISTNEIIGLFKGTDVKSNRITVADDIQTLNEEGFDIQVKRAPQHSLFYFGSREFELQELKLLMDAVTASRFITKEQTETLITKLKSMCSLYEAEALTSNIYIPDKVKSTNAKAFYYVDVLNEAINTGHRVSFQYMEYGPDKKRHKRHNGKTYENSPYGLVWDNDHYYMVGWSEEREKIVQFRVDRMVNVVMTERLSRRKGRFSMEKYVRENFSMYSGERKEVTLECDNDMMNAVIDKFGERVKVIKGTEDTFIVSAEVGDSPTFYGWVFQFAGRIRIIGSTEMINKYNDMLLKLSGHK